MGIMRKGKVIALANKETLVAAGSIISKLSGECNSPIIPVDSEHSAIFQCLQGEKTQVEKLLLTASGGPFRELKAADFEHITKEQALKHPNWHMPSGALRHFYLLCLRCLTFCQFLRWTEVTYYSPFMRYLQGASQAINF